MPLLPDSCTGHRAICLLATAGMFATSVLWISFLLSSPVYQQYAYTTPSFAMASPLAEAAAAAAAPASAPAEITTTGKLTPESMLAAPRRSAALPNEKGTHALFTVTNYSWETHKSSTELRLYNIKSKSTTLVATGVSDPHWVEGKILYLSGGDNGTTDFIITTIEAPTTTYSAGTVDGAIGDLKLQVLKSGKVAFVGTGKQTREGTLYNSEKADTPLTTARLYDSLYVRHWDTYVTPETNSLFYGTLSSNYGKYQISPLINALKGTHAESPIPPFGSTDNYDIGKSGILFSAKDPEVEPAYHTAAWTWFVATDFASQGKVQKIVAKGLGGLTSGPAFSPDGKSAAFLQMKETQYESDKNRIVYIPNLNDLSSATELFQTADGKGSWDRSPSALKFSNDGKTLLILADENARTLLFSTPATAKSSSKQPTHVTKTGHIIDMYPLSSTSDTLLLSGNSVIDNSYWSTVNFKEPSSYKLISSNSRNGAAWGLSPKQVSEIKYQGVKHEIQAWVITPSNFDKSKKYPLAYLIHGGPQGAWMDSWSTRWNPATWAEQGYVVVAPNPTGSTSFGKALTDEIQKNWGGSPYKEIELGFEYVKKNLPYVDTNNAIAAGASYGGYMINWIQGHPLGRKFKALVCHDGVFSMTNQISSDEQWFPVHDLGGVYWENREEWEKWDPARYTQNWATPQLTIHSELDYRLPISEGLAAFNVLQGRGIKSRFLAFPDEGHWVLNRENSRAWHHIVFNWINGYTGLPSAGEEPIVQSPQYTPWQKKWKN